MTRKAIWTGPDRSLRLKGQPARKIKRGDEFDIPDGEIVGGEGRLWKIKSGKADQAKSKSEE